MTTPITTPAAPIANHLYHQAIKVGNLVFCSGQLPVSVKDRAIVGIGDPIAQTRQIFANLDAILDAAGSALTAVIKTTVYLTSMEHFGAINAVYADYLPQRPARSCIAVRELPHPQALVEIEAVAQVQT